MYPSAADSSNEHKIKVEKDDVYIFISNEVRKMNNYSASLRYLYKNFGSESSASPKTKKANVSNSSPAAKTIASPSSTSTSSEKSKSGKRKKNKAEAAPSTPTISYKMIVHHLLHSLSYIIPSAMTTHKHHNDLLNLLFIEILYIKYALDQSNPQVTKDIENILHTFLEQRKALESEESTLFGISYTEWVKAFLAKRLRFVEETPLETTLNEHLELSRLNLFQSKELSPQIAEEIMRQIFYSIQTTIKKFTNKKMDYAQLQFLASNVDSLKKAFESGDPVLIQRDFIEAVSGILNYIAQGNMNVSSKTDSKPKQLLMNIMVILAAYFEKCPKSSQPYAEKVVNNTKKILLTHGSKFEIVALCFELFGNCFRMLEEQSQVNLYNTFRNYLKMKLNHSLLLYVMLRQFPFFSFMNYLKGVIGMCKALQDGEKIAEIVALVIRSSSMELNEKQMNMLQEAKKQQNKDGAGYDVKKDNYKLDHGRAIFMFCSIFCRSLRHRTSILTNEIIRAFKELKLEDSYTSFYGAVACILEKTSVQELLNEVVEPSVDRLRTSEENLEEVKVLTITAVCQISIYLVDKWTKENQLEKCKYLLVDLLWNFTIKGVIFAYDSIMKELLQVPINESKQSQLISAVKQHAAKNKLFIIRFIFLNSLASCSSDKSIIETLLNEIHSYAVDLHHLWHNYMSSLDAAPTSSAEGTKSGIDKLPVYAHKSPAVKKFMDDITTSVTFVLFRLFEHQDSLQPAHALTIIDILSYLEFSKKDSKAYQDTVAKSIALITSDQNKDKYLNDMLSNFMNAGALPQEKEIIPLSRLAFYLQITLACMSSFSDQTIIQRVVPFMFRCLTHKNTVIVLKAHAIFYWFFKFHHHIRHTLIPTYLQLPVFNKRENSALHELFLQTFVDVVGNIATKQLSNKKLRNKSPEFIQNNTITKSKAGLEHNIIKYCIETLTAAIESRMKGEVEASPKTIVSLIAVLIKISQVVPVELMDFAFSKISYIYHKAPEQQMRALFKLLYTVISGSMDYTRKHQSVLFYLDLLAAITS